jgi:hypothetical protein
MKKDLLLPNKLRKYASILLPFAAFFLYMAYNRNFSIPFLVTNIKINDLPGSTEHVDLTGTIALMSVFICLFLVAFTREKREDEYVQQVRLRALQISVYANYLVLGLGTLFVYGINFLLVMEFNLITILVLFIVIYYYQLHIKPKIFKSTAL